MACYAAVISLKHTIDRFSDSSHVSIHPKSRKILKDAYKEAQSLQQVLKRLDSSKSNSRSERMGFLDAQISEAICRIEDVLESQFLSQSETLIGDESDDQKLSFSLNQRELKQRIYSLIETVKKMRHEYSKELTKALPEDENDDDDGDDDVVVNGNKSKMVGLSDVLHDIRQDLRIGMSSDLQVCLLLGMAGIGKTTLAREIFEDQSITKLFKPRVWVTVGSKYRLNKILQCIAAQVDHGSESDKTPPEGDYEGLAEFICEKLKNKKYLIVLDDVWYTHVWDDLKGLFPKNNNGGRILITTRLQKVINRPTVYKHHQVRLLNNEESWRLLCEKVFGEEEYLCPHHLEKAGKKIAENCEGLPLTIVTVADIISKHEKTIEYWTKVAEKQNSVFTDAYDQILKVLLPSYNYLPQHLKPCFLYMGVFPQNCEISHSKLFSLWITEGILEYRSEPVEDYAYECLEDLLFNSLVMVRQKSSLHNLSLSYYQIKTCGIHSVFWYLCKKVAEKNSFFHIFNSYRDGLAPEIRNQRRLCIHNNILFAIKDVYNKMASISNARSLLCTGPNHRYPVTVPFYTCMRLLRVLDVVTIRFYEFPLEVVKLVQLRYFGMTCDGKIPSSISKLRNLEYLIVLQHLIIKSSNTPKYLPMEIWDMKELKYLHVVGRNFPDPSGGTFLPNLLTLLDVNTHSCTKNVFRGIPNLQKLRIRIESGIDDSKPLWCFSQISHLRQLQSLRCVIVNPVLGPKLVSPSSRFTDFPSGLRKLSLSGFGYPWDRMSEIALLPNLELLKLQCYAFRGPKWEMERKGFLGLKFLLIEDTDLECWRIGRGSFPKLERIIIKNCYKLAKITPEFGMFLQKIEVIDCNPVAGTNVEQIKVQLNDSRKHSFRFKLDVNVHSSWDDRKQGR